MSDDKKRQAARDFLRSAVMPLIEEVLVKKFCQTMDVIAEEREPPVVNESFTSEPVAWQLRTPEGRVILNKEFPAWADGGDGYKITPLYTAPQPAEQQPAEGEEIMVNTPYDVFTLPLQPSGLGGKGPRFVVHVPGPEQPAAPGVSALVEALENAARSLRTISKKAGTGEFMSEMYQVRGYAESRAWCAEEDLAAFRQGGVE